jgi:very-short-patch-repair endonuclease
MTTRRPRTITPETLARARELRRRPTAAETLLWRRLRSAQVEGFRFRRQQPIGRFIVDFFCSEAQLVIEIDGDTHAGRKAYDASRTEWLTKESYRVIRFMNTEVLRSLDTLLQVVLDECRRSRTNPSP